MSVYDRTSYRKILRVGVMVLTLAVVPTAALGQLTSESPFVHSPSIFVIDPLVESKQMADPLRFSHLFVLTDPLRLVAAFETASGRIGIKVFDSTTLSPVLKECFNFETYGTAWTWAAGTVHRGTEIWLTANPRGKKNVVPEGTHSLLAHWVPNQDPRWQVHDVPTQDKISALTVSNDGNRLYALTDPDNAFLSWNVDGTKMRRVADIFNFVPYTYPPGRCLWTSHAGLIWGSYKGRLFTFDPKAEFFAYLGMLPCEFGHLSEAQLSTMTQSESGLLTGGVSGTGYLFTVDSTNQRVISRGRPTDSTEIRTMVTDHQNVVWGIAATQGQSSRLFRFDPATGDLRDLGICAGRLRRGGQSWDWQAYQVGPMAVLPDGRIVLAEVSLQAKLLVFDPAAFEQ